MDLRAAEDSDTDLGVTPLTAEVLRAWPLPQPSPDGDKEERGRLLIIGSSREVPGAVMLAATAALRAGAGKLQIAVGASVAKIVAPAIPESRVIALPENAAGGIAAGAVDALHRYATRADAVLIGPGMVDELCVCELVAALLPALDDTKVILDAYAMSVLARSEGHTTRAAHPAQIERFLFPVVVTPHAGEMAHLTGIDKKTVLAHPVDTARDAALLWNAVVALKGSPTCIAGTHGRVWRYTGGNVGLAVSGSGDVLAGIIAGLAARGAALEQAAAWGVFLHGSAGEALAERVGPIGYLAREITEEIPALMHALSA